MGKTEKWVATDCKSELAGGAKSGEGIRINKDSAATWIKTNPNNVEYDKY